MTDFTQAIPVLPEPDWHAVAGIPIVDAGTPLEALGLSRDFSVWPAYHKLGIPHAIPECHARGEVFERLLRVAAALPGGVRLVVLDAWRPFAVQQYLYDSLSSALAAHYPRAGEAELERLTRQFVSPPSSSREAPSPHLTGGAVDVTLCDAQGRWLDMGSAFDEAVPASYTAYFERLAELGGEGAPVAQRRQAERGGELLAQRHRRTEAGQPGDRLHRMLGGFQQALGQGQAFGLQPLADGGAGELAEMPGEGPPAHQHPLCQAVQAVRLVEVLPQPHQQLAETAVLGAVRQRLLDELGLAALPMRRHHQAPGQVIGSLRAEPLAHQVQAAVDAGDGACRGQQAVVLDVQHVGLHPHRREAPSEILRPHPVGGGAATVEQPSLGQHEGPQAQAHQLRTACTGRDQRIQQRLWRTLVWIAPARHDHGLRLGQRFQPGLGLDGEPHRGSQPARLGGADTQVEGLRAGVVALLAEHQAGHRQVERTDAVEGHHGHGLAGHAHLGGYERVGPILAKVVSQATHSLRRAGTRIRLTHSGGNAMSARQPKRALLVIDVQNEYVSGNLRIEFPAIQSSLERIGAAMDAAHAAGIPIVVVQHLAPADSPLFARGSRQAELHEVVASRPYQHKVEKQLASSFVGTGLADWLRERDIDTLAVVGYMTQHCDDSTIRQAIHEGWQVEYLHDASGSVPYRNRAGQASAEEIHRIFGIVLQSSFAAVLSTEEWLESLAGRHVPERDNIYDSNQRALANR